jgi:hypothetical protein
VSLGTAEETPEKHFHSKISLNWFLISIDKHRLSILGEPPVDSLLDKKPPYGYKNKF